MISVADESKIQRRRRYTQLGAQKERLRKVTSTLEDISVEKKSFVKGAHYTVHDADMGKWRQQ